MDRLQANSRRHWLDRDHSAHDFRSDQRQQTVRRSGVGMCASRRAAMRRLPGERAHQGYGGGLM